MPVSIVEAKRYAIDHAPWHRGLDEPHMDVVAVDKFRRFDPGMTAQRRGVRSS